MYLMTIPDDPEGRYWVELAGANPDKVDQLRPTLLTFVGFDRDMIPKIAGTGFLVAADSALAVAITAKHVLTELLHLLL